MRRVASFLFLALLLLGMLMLPLVDAGTKTDISTTYGVYDRLAAYNYAQKYWDEVCSDGYFVNTRTTFIPLDPGTDITSMTGYDCAHFVSCCIGNEPHEPGGGLDVPNTAWLIYGELGATQLGDWLITSGNGAEKKTISELIMGDVINYDWDGDGHWDHAALYLGGSEVAGHTTSVWETDWQLIGAADYRFIHIPSTPWIVDDDGSADFDTIQEAINAASDGDTVFVRNGTYYEHVVVNRTVSLIGDDGSIIDGSGTGTVINVTSDSVSLEGFIIQNSGSQVGFIYSGVYLEGVIDCNISRNMILNNDCGLIIQYSSSIAIDENFVNCSSHNGIHLQWSSNNSIYRNTVATSGTYGIWLDYSSNNTVSKNNVSNGEYYGIRLYSSSHNVLDWNDYSNNYIGLHIVHSMENTIYHNNFVSNWDQVYIDRYSRISTVWDNGCEGNYWNDYNGTDLNSDGIGDTNLPWEGVDNCPLMNRYWNPADVDHDFDVDLYDAVKLLLAYGSEPGDDNWNPHCDIAEPYGQIDLFDATLVLINYGKKYT